MTRVNTRARVAIGTAALAVAGLGVGFAGASAVSASAPPSEPPSSEPASSGPAGSAPELDADRERIVDAIITMSEAEGIPFDRDCVSGLVAQLPDADVPLVLDDIEEESAAESADDAADAATAPADTMTMDTMTMDTMTMGSEAEISEEAERLALELVNCIAGDADPALVSEALAVIEADEEMADADLECVEAVLTSLEDESLQAIIDEGSVGAIDDSMDDGGSMETAPNTTGAVAGTDASITEDDPNTFLLFVCIPGFMDMDVDAMAADTATVDTVTADSAAGDSGSDY